MWLWAALIGLGLLILLLGIWLLWHYTTVAPMGKIVSHLKTMIPCAHVNISQLFDRVFVIALPQRKQYIQQALASYDIREYTFVPPVMATAVPPVSGLRQAQIACHRSHLRALRMFLADPSAHHALIFEDDIKPCPGTELYRCRLKQLQQELRAAEWDIVYLGKCFDRCLKYRYVSLQLATNATPVCRHAYAVTRKGAKIIIEATTDQTRAGDTMVRQLIRDGRLQALAVVPSIFYQNREKLGTTLGNNQTLSECLLFGHFYEHQRDSASRPKDSFSP